MQIGLIGLGRMGAQIAARLLKGGHEVILYNRTAAKIKPFKKMGAAGAVSVSGFLAKLSKPRIVWLMIPAGDPVSSMVEKLTAKLSKGDILIDGGNSHYPDSIRRAGMLAKKGIHFLDVGTSGGIWGLERGFCLMIGGPEKAFKKLRPVFKTLSRPDGYLHTGENGTGHFVKMVHNAIEYGMLQAYGEGFEMLHASGYRLDFAKIAHLWNQGSVIRSWLLELAEQIFEREPRLDSVRDYVEDSGEGRWAVHEAIRRNISAPVITLSLLERLRSRETSCFSAKTIAALRREFGAHRVKKDGRNG